MSEKIAFISSRKNRAVMSDDRPVANELESRGFEVVPLPWGENTDGLKAAVFRSCSDYAESPNKFIEWLTELEENQVLSINSPDVIRGNLDKGYLLGLEALGIPIIPTRKLEAGECLNCSDLFKIHQSQDIVIKPAISTSGFDTLRLRSPSDQSELVKHLLSERAMLVQPYMNEIEAGELSFVFFNSEFSHAVKKNASSHDFRTQPRYGGSRVPFAPDVGLIAQAKTALDAIGRECTYARVDAIVVNSNLLVMEVELIEPCLYLSGVAGAASRFATAITESLNRLTRIKELERNDRAIQLTP